MSKFADRLFSLRTQNKLTQEGLSDILKDKYDVETNKSMVSKYEKGIHEPGFTFIDYVADYFGVTTDWLMGRSENKYYSDNTQGKKVPIIKEIAADIQNMSGNNIISYEYTNENCDFCVKVFDDNMSGAGMKTGSLAYIKKQSVLQNGEVGLFLINGQPAIHRIIKENSYVMLKSDNTEYDPIIFSKKDFKQVAIIGKVIGIKFNL